MYFSKSCRSISKILVVAIALIGVSTMTGCKRKTPEEKFQEAQKLLQEGGQMPLAMFRMKDIVEQHPDSEIVPDVQLTMASVYESMGGEDNFAKALREYEAVYKKRGIKDERGIYAHGAMTKLYMQTNQVDKAIENVAEGVQAAAGEPALESELKAMHARIQLQGSTEEVKKEGLDYLNKTMEDKEASAENRNTVREYMAQFYRAQEKYEEANAVYQKYISLYPDEAIVPELKMAMAINLKMLDKVPEAETLFAEGEAAYNKRIEEELVKDEKSKLLFTLSSYQQGLGDLDAAEQSMMRIMKENQGTQVALQTQFQIAEMYGQAGKFDKMEEILNRIKADNAGTPIEQMADQQLQKLAQVKQQIAEMEAQQKKAAEAGEGAAAPAGEAPKTEETSAPAPEATTEAPAPAATEAPANP